LRNRLRFARIEHRLLFLPVADQGKAVGRHWLADNMARLVKRVAPPPACAAISAKVDRQRKFSGHSLHAGLTPRPRSTSAMWKYSSTNVPGTMLCSRGLHSSHRDSVGPDPSFGRVVDQFIGGDDPIPGYATTRACGHRSGEASRRWRWRKFDCRSSFASNPADRSARLICAPRDVDASLGIEEKRHRHIDLERTLFALFRKIIGHDARHGAMATGDNIEKDFMTEMLRDIDSEVDRRRPPLLPARDGPNMFRSRA